jgi:hypothetical protein
MLQACLVTSCSVIPLAYQRMRAPLPELLVVLIPQ